MPTINTPRPERDPVTEVALQYMIRVQLEPLSSTSRKTAMLYAFTVWGAATAINTTSIF